MQCIPSIKSRLSISVAALSMLVPAAAFANQDARLTAAPSTEDMRLYDIANATSASRLQQDVAKLVSFGTRHTLSDTGSDTQGIGAARRWIHAEFEQISKDCGGCLEVISLSDTVTGKRIPNPTEVVNVIAIQHGTLDPKRVVMMSGDIYSRVTDVMNAKAMAPGANDNASGVAGAIEAA